jgi:hypothetical protein
MVQGILNKDFIVEEFQQIQSVLQLFNHSLDANRYALAFRVPQPIALSTLWKDRRLFVAELTKTYLRKLPQLEMVWVI